MKKVMYYTFSLSVILFSTFATGCSGNDDDILEEGSGETVVEGPSIDDVLTLPSEPSFLGDSIQFTKTFSLAEYSIKEVKVSTTQNGHISVLGGYKGQSGVYIYAKIDDNRGKVSDEQIKNILDKYYIVESYASGTEIVATVKENTAVTREADFRNLRITVQVFTPRNVSTTLQIARGSIIAKNVHGNQHTATSTSGTIKYIDSSGKNFTLTSDAGHIGLINTPATGSIHAKMAKGTIQIALPKDTKATLSLESSTRVNAHILNKSNFQGVNTRTKVEGTLNGGGYELKAINDLGVINLSWYDGRGGNY
ncbi:hypothetical protein M2459_001667 [Parabacteroides sp. PF5-5]|uniref:DUF4097 family beta strand repeat-containing protein n=1 Tax=unclassified Parabacteroides TaxID=2649774 RepID=UPI002476B901|nr:MULTISPECIES: DUF4097 family beta strand repeat-containing protein [unclassified Parabacteroides]MDH6304930.1 hypothetical protein [Parabacteroides sp. PH5-39]MDH6315984.1 hypothetical protein [Parabacteroides sp. PF5-13]MDH6319641.1 hypothetical protein [Parabacteroides sp. PH5-13]MDH6323372.1 hypothetical protein [Parabacteroides sp. PH5-8]MDH6327119.1 hypothetical protein [Parabacteroides sp. PH5-41]